MLIVGNLLILRIILQQLLRPRRPPPPVFLLELFFFSKYPKKHVSIGCRVLLVRDYNIGIAMVEVWCNFR